MEPPITPFIEKYGIFLLDGGLATELEARGSVLDSHLWSAQLLMTNPSAIRDVHRAYLEAGAHCIISSSYQASVPGFQAIGVSKEEACALLLKTVTLACEAREAYWSQSPLEIKTSIRPLVAASIGPYGAYLANGSEYDGNYGISQKDLFQFHEERWKLFQQSEADLLACETIPSYEEAKVLRTLLERSPSTWAWVSFSCRDEIHISDGTPLQKSVALFEDCPSVMAVGINCTTPKYLPSLIQQAQKGAPSKYIVVYPNSGEIYNKSTKRWSGLSSPSEFGQTAQDWHRAGVRLIGGCCRTRPQHIKTVYDTFVANAVS